MKYQSLFGEYDIPDGEIIVKPLSMLDDEKVDPMIENTLFKSSYALIHGKKETYKSFLAAYLAIAITSGIPFFGQKVHVTGKVAYIYGEGAMIKRFRRLLKGFNVPHAAEWIYPIPVHRYLEDKESQQTLAKLIPADTVLVIFDNYEKFWSSDMDDKIVASAMSFIRALRQKTSVLLVQHQRKNSGTKADAHDLSRGSGKITGPADTTFSLVRHGRMVKCEMYHRDGEKPPLFSFHLKDIENEGILVIEADSNESLDSLSEQKIKIHLAEITSPTSPTGIYNILKGKGIKGLSTEAFYKEIFPSLLRDNVLIEVEKKKYIYYAHVQQTSSGSFQKSSEASSY